MDATDGDATRTLERVHGLSFPADAVQTSYQGGELSAYSLSAEWKFETALTWVAYCALVRDRLSPEFEARDVGTSRARFVRRLSGDVYSVGIEREPSEHGLRVRVHFVASAY